MDTGLSFDPHEAKKFLNALCASDCENTVFTFQTFRDGKTGRFLGKTWSGTFTRESAANMERRNQAGAGIFVTINVTDGKGRTNKNVTAVRALFVDLDGSPIEPVQQWPLNPYIIIESSPGRYHAYWRHDGSIKLENFRQLQLKLAVKFNGDPSALSDPHHKD
jgi:putative DNA primase/helicase